MAQPPVTIEQMQAAVNAAVAHENIRAAARSLGLPEGTFRNRLIRAKDKGMVASVAPIVSRAPVVENVEESLRHKLLRGALTLAEMKASTGADESGVLDALDAIKASGASLIREGDRWRISKVTQAAWTTGDAIEIVSRPDNTFLFGAAGDQHIASKYHREDVSRQLHERYERHKVQAVFNTGNWIDGEASFNRYDLEAHGLDGQVRLMAEIHPKHDFPTYAVWGDDHEGWYAQREGINVGHYAEGIMRSAGHNWHDVGFMEAHIRLVNANTGKAAILAVVHPGGGSSYAVSYRPQKIIESYDGGEKPAVLLLGHYHKLDCGQARNVWYAQTGTSQDQTPFMRKKSLEAHVGGLMMHLEQDPDTGAITGFTPSLWRFFNREYYAKSGAANGRWSKHASVRPMPRGVQP